MVDIWQAPAPRPPSPPEGVSRLARVERTWNEDERAALVALLRTRPDRLTWADITAEVAALGSARTFWDELHPARLFDEGDADALSAAARDIAGWRTAHLGFLTFRDHDYPALGLV